MTFAVVYLIEPKKHVVKNYGVNQNQTHKIFWSENSEIPDFDAVESVEFPPNGGEGCYKGRVLRFFGRKFLNNLFNIII